MIKKPGFTLVVVLTLALGIGANTAIFTVVNAALLRGLPYRAPDQLVHLFETKPQKEFPQREASYPDFLDWRQNEVFSGVAAYAGGGSAALSGREDRERVQIGAVTGNFFAVLGVEPIIGRSFRAEEENPGTERTVLLTHGLWQRIYGGDPAVVGRTIELNETPFMIVGVLPPSFHFAPRGGAQIWMVWRPSEQQRNRRFMHWVNVVARLKDGVGRTQAEASMQVIAGRIAAAYPESHAGTGIKLVPLQEQFVGGVRELLIALLAAVGVVLLIACANIANLLLARAMARQREIAIRMALGATRGQLIRQLLAESMILAIVGGAVGLLIAQWGAEALVAAIPEGQLNFMPYLRHLDLDLRLLAFAAGISLLTGILFGLAPALGTTRGAVDEALRGGGRAGSSPGRQRMRNLLVIAEIALSFVLLVGAGLMIQSLARLFAVNLGFNPHHVATLEMSLPPTKYETPEKVAAFQDQLAARLSSVPGVRSTATIDVLPLAGGNTSRFFVLGEGSQKIDESPEVNVREVSESYFQTMGVPLVAGREFSARDDQKAPRVLIINRTLAERLLKGQDVVGRQVVFSGDNPTPYEIVGVVGDERVNGLDARISPVAYTSSRQDSSRMTSLVVRTDVDPRTLATAIRREALAFEPHLSVFNIISLEDLMATAPETFARRYPALLIGIFATLAVVLAAIGIYGVISYAVSQQTREFGIRLALGAEKKDILRLIMGRGLALAGGGIGVGLVVALIVTRWLGSLLFGISPTDPATYGALAAVLAAVALLACYLPARRATRVDPIIALREE
jgi:putative ABC transport system permease protein